MNISNTIIRSIKVFFYVMCGLILLILSFEPLLYLFASQTPEEFCHDAVKSFQSAQSYKELKDSGVACYSMHGKFYLAATGLSACDLLNEDPGNGVIVIIDYTGRITAWDHWNNACIINFFFDGYGFERKAKTRNDCWPERANLSRKEAVEKIRKEISSVARFRFEFVNKTIQNEYLKHAASPTKISIDTTNNMNRL